MTVEVGEKNIWPRRFNATQAKLLRENQLMGVVSFCLLFGWFVSSGCGCGLVPRAARDNKMFYCLERAWCRVLPAVFSEECLHKKIL